MKKMEAKVKELKELRAAREKLDKSISEVETWIKDEMEREHKYEFEGDDWKVSWKMVSSLRFNQSLFKDAYPDIFEQYKTLSESRRFTVQ